MEKCTLRMFNNFRDSVRMNVTENLKKYTHGILWKDIPPIELFSLGCSSSFDHILLLVHTFEI